MCMVHAPNNAILQQQTLPTTCAPMPDAPSNMYIKHQSERAIFESPYQGPSVQPLYHVVQYQQIQHNWSLFLDLGHLEDIFPISKTST